MELSERDKSRVRVHLGYADYAGIQASEVEMLESAMATVRDEYVLVYIKKMLDTLDNIFDLRDPTNPDSFTQLQVFLGDINRTRKDISPVQSDKLWDQIYKNYCKRLAQLLYVTNFNDAEDAFRFSRSGAQYINAAPGMAVPNAGSKIYLHQYLA